MLTILHMDLARTIGSGHRDRFPDDVSDLRLFPPRYSVKLPFVVEVGKITKHFSTEMLPSYPRR